MKIYIGFDDTDISGADRGTGKLARWFAAKLPDGARLWGVVRQQFPRLPGIPFTSNNSSACLVVDVDKPDIEAVIIDRAVDHLAEHFIPGSDPGLCVVAENSPAVSRLMEFGRTANSRIVSQEEAFLAAEGVHLSAHGGTGDGIIGAAAGVGLTFSGWSGRFIQFGDLRGFDSIVAVADLEKAGIRVISIDRDALVPGARDVVDTEGWLRPRLWGHIAVLPVKAVGPGKWRTIAAKRKA